MARLLLVCGPTGAGKTTYSLSISKEVGAIRFSIDPWMQTFGVQRVGGYERDARLLQIARKFIHTLNRKTL